MGRNARAAYLRQYCEKCDKQVTSCPHYVNGYDLAKLPCGCPPKQHKQIGGVLVTSVRRLSPSRSKPDVYQCPQCATIWDVVNGRDVENVRSVH